MGLVEECSNDGTEEVILLNEDWQDSDIPKNEDKAATLCTTCAAKYAAARYGVVKCSKANCYNKAVTRVKGVGYCTECAVELTPPKPAKGPVSKANTEKPTPSAKPKRSASPATPRGKAAATKSAAKAGKKSPTLGNSTDPDVPGDNPAGAHQTPRDYPGSCRRG